MRRVTRAAAHLMLMLVAAAVAFPVLWAVVTSVKPTAVLYDANPFAAAPTLDHYRGALEALPVVRVVLNTAIMSAAVAVGQVAIATLAAYGLTRYRLRGRRVAFAVLIGTALVPQQALVVPHYLMVSRLGLLDSFAGLVLPQLASSALAVFILRQQMAAFPDELIEAATLAGASDRLILFRIVVPNLRPILTAVAIIVFIQTWNEYLWPLLATDGVSRATVQVGLRIFETEQGTAWGPLMAAAVLVAAPLVVAYAFVQRRVTDAFIRSGLG
ncbi:carbohydrate ABC transporter membrane protein 2 (CUT1 family) [Haloactinopolyspora alba]|uniref:Carbohydrate ABC transporter membrane protein 2 (CUT1 family) n=1 Tax=Haloactinopolyspora alba TaxID=648780 RepID=A0A2P8E955_9ACTN|nr:carbohydrate ABC transporter permease [Haloactinopolyspora alba]PSL05937.1 carbohydrate ABC transporter membrane protein 2 (CUT1 family) [Haloactinopolyspora alba]